MKPVLTAGGTACLLLLLAPIVASQVTPKEEAAQPTQVIRERPQFAAHRFPLIPAWIDLKTGLGYSYTSMAMPSASRIAVCGIDVPLIADVAPSFGFTGDATYGKATDLFASQQHIDLLSYVAGPTVYPIKRRKFRLYGQALFGGARVGGGIPNTKEYTGYVNRFSWAVGGGIEYRLGELVAWRSGGVYQQTSFYNSNLTIRPQNDFRLISSLVLWVSRSPKSRY